MRKKIKGKILSRTKSVREALLNSLMRSLIIREKITTTEAKAKALRPNIERLITRFKKDNNINIIRHLKKHLDHETAQKMIKEISPRYKDRNGGYTRIIKLAPRENDQAKMAVIEFI